MIFRSGERVQIVCSGEDLESCAGGWNPEMNRYVGDGNIYTIDYRDQSSNGPFGYYLREIGWFWDERLLSYYGVSYEAFEPVEDGIDHGDLSALFGR